MPICFLFILETSACKMGCENHALNQRHQKRITQHNEVLHEESKLEGSAPTPLSIRQNLIDRVAVKDEELPEKLFRTRNSLFTDLVDLPYMRTVVVFALVISVHICMTVAIEDVFMFSRPPLGIPGVINFFKNICTSASIWTLTFLFTFTTYFGFYAWANTRPRFYDKPAELKRYDRWCAWTWFMSNALVTTYFSLYTLFNRSKIVVPVLLMAEIVRMMMKVVAFVRSNAPRVLERQKGDDLVCPRFSQFLYFLFAPTLLYKDNYPRTKHIRWNFVALHFSISILATMCTYFVYDYMLVPSVDQLDLKTVTFGQFFVLSLKNAFASSLHMMCTFAVLLHSWQNAFAEMLRFGDRLFYKDWWNSVSYSDYYRKWNTIVHDWLYTYIYKDVYNNITSKNKTLSRTTVVFVSSFFHEVILSISYGFIFPIFSFFYLIIGVPASYVKVKNPILANVLFLYTYSLGIGFIYTGWILEYRARQECPVEHPVFEFFLARFFSWNYCK